MRKGEGEAQFGEAEVKIVKGEKQHGGGKKKH